ncbi:hypothetical protein Tco_0751780 [Tanacetum coccineum]|uniref:Uncharacterized protein n=1 Tax=Tanacetum coccineum TaxID=301880 RepID=A0ABQ4Z4Z8_9ASTR
MVISLLRYAKSITKWKVNLTTSIYEMVRNVKTNEYLELDQSSQVFPKTYNLLVDMFETAQEIWVTCTSDDDRQIARPSINLGQDNQMQMVGGNGGNQFSQYVRQNVGNQVVQNAVQNPGVQNVGNQNGVIVVPGIAHQNENGNVVVALGLRVNANGTRQSDKFTKTSRGLSYLARNCHQTKERDQPYLQTPSADWLKRKNSGIHSS